MSRETYNYKRKALVAARELGYSNEVIKKIQDADREEDIVRIMKSARK